jgi:hypothetical protein
MVPTQKSLSERYLTIFCFSWNFQLEMQVGNFFIIYLVKATEFSSICILEMNNSNVKGQSIKEQCLIKSTLKSHHFTSKLISNNTTITTKPRLNCSYFNMLINTKSAMGNPNWLEGQIFAKQSCRGPK